MQQEVRPETIQLSGGVLCLDFANSVDWSEDGGRLAPTDALTDPDALGRWGRRLGVYTGEPPRIAHAELAAAKELRDALHALFSAIAEGAEPPPAARERLAREHAEAVAAARLAGDGDGWRLDWAPRDPRRVRYAVAVDAVRLLTDSARLARVRRCPGHRCGWLFLDTSGRRRWCSMQTCGSREKMRRLYARRRAERR